MNISSLIGEVLRVVETARDEPVVKRIFPAQELERLEEHRKAGKRRAKKIVRNDADAEEVVDQAIYEIEEDEEEPEDTRVAVVNKSKQRAIDLVRKRDRRRTQVNTAAANGAVVSRSPHPQVEVEAAEYRELLEAAIRTLPLGDQPAATLYYRDGYAVNEISRALGIGYQPVYRSLKRSRPKLLEALPEEYHEQLRPFPERPYTA